MKYTLPFVFILFICYSALAQPGYSLERLQFRVVNEKGAGTSAFEMQWRNHSYQQNKWHKAVFANGVFETERIRSDYQPTELKIYRPSGFDTMFISCSRSLNRIPFSAGIFQLSESQCYLVNMETLNGTVIINKVWDNFRQENLVTNKSILIRKRFFYMSQNNASMIENDTDVMVSGYTTSQHLKTSGYNGITEYIQLGKLYYAPIYSPSVYCIGYLAHDEDDKEKYSEFLMESVDGCRSWNIKFPLPDNTVNLVSMTESMFTFHISYPGNRLFSFNHWGKLLDSMIIYDAPCNLAGNVFYTCNANEVRNNSDDFESSDPFMDGGSFNHTFHNVFSTAEGSRQVRIDKLPYDPQTISVSNDGGSHWKKILELNSKETYVYLTQRKEKLVLVSYHYTLVSHDFGKSWTFYENGTFSGGEWNFIWLDDNTLVNVTPYYADFMEIL